MQHKHIHHLLDDTIFNVETHPRKTTKALFIWHEKYMAPLVYALSCMLYSIPYPLYLCTLLSPLTLFNHIPLKLLLLDSTFDMHITWINCSSLYFYSLSCRIFTLLIDTKQLTDSVLN